MDPNLRQQLDEAEMCFLTIDRAEARIVALSPRVERFGTIQVVQPQPEPLGPEFPPVTRLSLGNIYGNVISLVRNTLNDLDRNLDAIEAKLDEMEAKERAALQRYEEPSSGSDSSSSGNSGSSVMVISDGPSSETTSQDNSASGSSSNTVEVDPEGSVVVRRPFPEPTNITVDLLESFSQFLRGSGNILNSTRRPSSSSTSGSNKSSFPKKKNSQKKSPSKKQ